MTTTTTHADNLRVAGASVQLSAMPGGHPYSGLESAAQPPPRLRPGAAITFAIVAVVGLLAIIEIMLS